MVDGVPKEGAKAPEVLMRVAMLHLVRQKVCTPGTSFLPALLFCRLPCGHGACAVCGPGSSCQVIPGLDSSSFLE